MVCDWVTTSFASDFAAVRSVLVLNAVTCWSSRSKVVLTYTRWAFAVLMAPDASLMRLDVNV